MIHYKVIYAKHGNGSRRSRKFIERDAATFKGSIGNCGTHCDNPLQSAIEFKNEIYRIYGNVSRIHFWDTQDPTQESWKKM